MRKDTFAIEPFPGLDRFQSGEERSRPLRVCIATEEIYGVVRNGGIASTYYHLARLLAENGHDVTVCYLKGHQCEIKTLPHWVAYYQKLGIQFVPLKGDGLQYDGPGVNWLKRYNSFYQWLKRQPKFDIVHTSEWRGGAYYALLAKKLGLAFEDTLFLVKSSSPWIWNRHYMMQSITNIGQMVYMFAERRTLEMGDLVIGGSAHLLNFMRHKGYALPEHRTMVQPNIIDFQDLNVVDKRRPRSLRGRISTRDVVFFGRLEARKGLDVFCEAVNRLVRQGHTFDKITFLGKEGVNMPTLPDVKPLDYIADQAKHWNFPWEIIDTYDQDKAISYLCEKPRIAVMPSVIENSSMAVYECLIHKVPFLATRSGGTPELIDPAFHEETLIELHPESLANSLSRLLRKGAVVAEPVFDAKENVEVWLRFHAYLAEQLAQKKAPEVLADMERALGGAGTVPHTDETAPTVSLCVYFHNRPMFLNQLVESVLCQSDLPDEIIVHADGEPEGTVKTAWDFWKKRFKDDPRWRFVVEPHRCLGASWNSTARMATGDVLLFVDTEFHALEPECVATVRRAAAGCDALAYTCIHDVMEGGGVTRRLPVGDDLATSFYDPAALGGDVLAAKRQSFLDAGGFREFYHMGGVVQEFLSRVCMQGLGLMLIPECLVRERVVTQRSVDLNEAGGAFLRKLPHLENAPYYHEAIFMRAMDVLKEHDALVERNRELEALLGQCPGAGEEEEP